MPVAAEGGNKLPLRVGIPGNSIGERGNGASKQKREATDQRESMGAKVWARKYGRESMGAKVWARKYGRESMGAKRLGMVSGISITYTSAKEQ